MIRRSIIEISEMVKGVLIGQEHSDEIIQGICTDSRNIQENQLFIPLQGENFDGHVFIDKVAESGAKAALWSRHVPLPSVAIPLILVEDTLVGLQELAKAYRSQLKTTIVGITGSNGKTSTKDILASILSVKYKTHKTFQNFNNQIGVPLTLLEMEESAEMAVVEMGMFRLGEIQLLTTIAAPDVAVITNIGEAHMEWLKTRENVVRAKLEILEGLKENGPFIYFGDDPLLQRGISTYPQSYPKITFGQDPENDYKPILEEINDEGITFSLDLPDHPSFYLPMLGKHQMLNATAAIAAARSLGMSFDEIRIGLKQVEATGMRNELVHCKGFTILNDAYKSNPPSLKAALETLYALKGYTQKIAVLGDMTGLGEEAPKMHEEIGESLDENLVDYIFTLGTLANHIAEKAKEKFPAERVISVESKEALLEKLKKVIEKDAIILVKGSREMRLEDVIHQLQKGDIKI
ncbi:UDP-N-acetylmuramoyl-tripeptide--D-alanyl-D-alanine ligase [Anaerosolibacter carboniphilus]|uniref:UDP-N-acetylmuramoyl-tripeptide--D-alanyl-D-alanine ligase n=1 Tax=Anaerosolibacter carboniphilus TaxID=1417629 RepID=A0A841KYM2_9FIRM|nr:UDP-N-acetylmuramoyl-tripeptide--D-alanyl-D-alanine ligase [Anaerosolibacter carboniphilus]MBB6218724.1 UDP-N-acetylmuramoyl-tripeptide--D-alanyl-D-alanine ligase [Anaerosolibacter carboniphilus]